MGGSKMEGKRFEAKKLTDPKEVRNWQIQLKETLYELFSDAARLNAGIEKMRQMLEEQYCPMACDAGPTIAPCMNCKGSAGS